MEDWGLLVTTHLFVQQRGPQLYHNLIYSFVDLFLFVADGATAASRGSKPRPAAVAISQ